MTGLPVDDGLTLQRFFLNLLFFCLCSEEEDVLVKERVCFGERKGSFVKEKAEHRGF